MGCVSSTILSHNDDFPHQLGSTALSHHIVSLTSTTYGLLTLDPHSSSSPPHSPPVTSTVPSPEIINSWELMAGLDNGSFRFSSPPDPDPDPKPTISSLPYPNPSDKENLNPNLPAPPGKYSLDMFEKLCPPNGDNRVVIYTTTLRGIRETFEACNAVRAAFEGLGVAICDRDVSMDRGFREELRELLRGKKGNDPEEAGTVPVPPRVFVMGRYLGGAERVLRMHEEGCLGELLQGLPENVKAGGGQVCDGCGGVRFLPCFRCNGSCKVVITSGVMAGAKGKRARRTFAVVKCPDCNENGLVLCPICA